MSLKFGNAAATARFNSGVTRWLGLALLLLLAFSLVPAMAAHPMPALLCLGAVVPIGGHSMRFFAPDYGGAPNSFEAKVLDEISNVAGSLESLKTLTDEVHKLRNDQGTMESVLRQVRRIQLHSARERSGFALDRIKSDPEMNARLNAAVRLAVSSGDLENVAKKIIGRALGEDSSPGSTMINDALGQEIYDTLASYGSWSTLGVRPMGTKLTKMPVKTARPVAYALMSEGDTIPDDANKAGTSVNLEVEVIAVLLNVSLQLLQDEEFDVTNDVMNDFAEAFSHRLDYMVFQGAGTSTGTAAKLHGGCTGLFNFGTAATAVSGNTTIQTLDLEDFINCLTTVDPVVLTRKAKWWLHPTTLARIVSIKDGNGRPLFQTALEAPAPGAIGSILGYPVVLTLSAPGTNTAGSKVAVFGDPEGYVVGVRQDFSFEASDHHRWNTLQRSFRGYGRANGKGRKSTAFAVLTTAAS